MNLKVAEGWTGTDTARHHIAFAALPDGHTVVGLEYSRNAGKRSYLVSLKGMHFAFANDLYNDFRRRVFSASSERLLSTPAAQDEVISLGGVWANIDNRVGVIGIYGAPELSLHRSAKPRGENYHSLLTEEICFRCELETRAMQPDEVLLDIGWMVISDASAEQTRLAADETSFFARESVRAARVLGQNGKIYGVIFNFGEAPCDTTLLDWDLRPETIAAGQAQIFVLP